MTIYNDIMYRSLKQTDLHELEPRMQHIEPGDQASSLGQTCCEADDLFAQALRDDSNRELDWLWLYVQVTDASQRRYCLERALAINPKSEMALRALAAFMPGQRVAYGGLE